MVTHPANMVMTIIPRVLVAFAGFDRIQAFLLQESLSDCRGILPKATLNKFSWDPTSGHLIHPIPVINMHELSIGHKKTILKSINIEIAAGSLAIVSGPTGSGKSTLLRAILGEVIPIQGSIGLSTRQIAYCSQKSWLPTGTIKETIYGATDIYSTSQQDHERWYHEVLEICCLTHDFDYLPDGDQTQIGSMGLNLSGGQRQRVVRFLVTLNTHKAKNCRLLHAHCLHVATYFYLMTLSVPWMVGRSK
jgi:ABC-type multidrug transport system fused ATPase/permease subunit